MAESKVKLKMLKIHWNDCNGECIPEWSVEMDTDTALDLVNYLLDSVTSEQKPDTQFKTDNGVSVNFVLIA